MDDGRIMTTPAKPRQRVTGDLTYFGHLAHCYRGEWRSFVEVTADVWVALARFATVVVLTTVLAPATPFLIWWSRSRRRANMKTAAQ